MPPSHFAFFCEYSDPICLPLPDKQPKCPKQWTEEDWNNRVVVGNYMIHHFRTAGNDVSFILKVSSVGDDQEMWAYEDFDFDSKYPTEFLVQGESANQVLSELEKQEEAFPLLALARVRFQCLTSNLC